MKLSNAIFNFDVNKEKHLIYTSNITYTSIKDLNPQTYPIISSDIEDHKLIEIFKTTPYLRQCTTLQHVNGVLSRYSDLIDGLFFPVTAIPNNITIKYFGNNYSQMFQINRNNLQIKSLYGIDYALWQHSNFIVPLFANCLSSTSIETSPYTNLNEILPIYGFFTSRKISTEVALNKTTFPALKNNFNFIEGYGFVPKPLI